MLNGQKKICIVSDGTDSIAQSRELALRLTSPENITRIYKDDDLDVLMSSRAKPWDQDLLIPLPSAQDDKKIDSPDLAIGVGFNVTDMLVKLKDESEGKTKIAVILDPLAHYEKFDFIILPSYEPYNVFGNVIRTTGLINFVNDKYLAAQKNEFDNHKKYAFLRELLSRNELKPPYLTVVIGGRHTGGNIDIEDAKIIADKINKIISASKGSALITTSKRTELAVAQTLKEHLKVPYFLYDYKLRETENPYGPFLALADEIIVTGESTRMMSETCSTGKPVLIYRPREYGFQYKPLVNELINGGYAYEFDSYITNPQTKKLDEAGRIAEIIKNKLY